MRSEGGLCSVAPKSLISKRNSLDTSKDNPSLNLSFIRRVLYFISWMCLRWNEARTTHLCRLLGGWVFRSVYSECCSYWTAQTAQIGVYIRLKISENMTWSKKQIPSRFRRTTPPLNSRQWPGRPASSSHQWREGARVTKRGSKEARER